MNAIKLPTGLLCLAWAAVATAMVMSVETGVHAADSRPGPATVLVSGNLDGCVLAAGSKRVLILDRQGNVTWEHPTALTHDAWMLPNGNVLFADGASVTEVTPEHKVVFQYRAAESRGGGTYACQRLENGHTVIGENSTGRLLEVDAAGKTVHALQTSPAKTGDHHNLRMVRKLDSGNYLVCHSGAHLVKEYAPDGKVVLEIKAPNLAFAAIRTPQNTTLVSTLSRILEYDAAGKIVWQFANTDIPGVPITNMTGMHLLPDGRLAVGCYSAYRNGEGTGLFVITRDRQLVWRYSNPARDGSMMALQCLGAEGRPLPGKCLR
jgi:hypothetical protein